MFRRSGGFIEAAGFLEIKHVFRKIGSETIFEGIRDSVVW